MSCQDTAKITGQHQLFCGTSTISWTIAQFQEAAQFAKSHGIDSLIIKCADGSNRWYGGLSGYQNIKKAIQAEGIGVIPYTYSYGDKYNAIDAEIDILIAYMQDSGVVVADMEQEWNGQVGWAQHLCSRMQGQSGVFLVSTWSDPSLQNWTGVLQALNPCVSAYLPQQYNTYLGSFWSEFGNTGALCLQPTLNMTQDFGPNDPVALAKAAYQQGHTAISVWYYETAVANPSLLDAIYAAFPKTLSGGNTTMSTSQAPNGWSDSNNVLTAPNKEIVVLGFRDHILNDPTWDANNWPLGSEEAANPVEESNPSLGPGSAQEFRLCRLCYTAQRGVYVSWIGQELQWYQQQYNALQAQIAALKALPAIATLSQINALSSQIVKLSVVQ